MRICEFNTEKQNENSCKSMSINKGLTIRIINIFTRIGYLSILVNYWIDVGRMEGLC